MHEFAIAQDIVMSLEEKLGREIEFIAEIDIEAGAFSGIVDESLSFGLETILSEKNIKKVMVNITHKPAEAFCECGNRYPINNVFDLCPHCGSAVRDIPGGNEITVNSVSLREKING